jgi:cytochrome c-type biogenesis protein CcmH/NrfF
MSRCVVMLLLLLLGSTIDVRAAEAVPLADDAVLEARVDGLAAQLRCLVCQNQSLADSHAGLAIDLKNQVREQLRAGRDEAQVIDYMTQRYGDFVLYRPPWKATTALLWAGPALLALLGLALAWRTVSRPRRTAPAGTAGDAVARATDDAGASAVDLQAAQPPADWSGAAADAPLRPRRTAR